MGGAALGAAALSATGLGRGQGVPAAGDELLVIDEADRLARPMAGSHAEERIDKRHMIHVHQAHGGRR